MFFCLLIHMLSACCICQQLLMPNEGWHQWGPGVLHLGPVVTTRGDRWDLNLHEKALILLGNGGDTDTHTHTAKSWLNSTLEVFDIRRLIDDLIRWYPDVKRFLQKLDDIRMGLILIGLGWAAFFGVGLPYICVMFGLIHSSSHCLVHQLFLGLLLVR